MPPPASVDPAILRAGSRLVWWLIAGMIVAVAAICWAAHLSIDFHALPRLAPVLAVTVPVTLFYRLFRPDPKIVYCTETITQIFLISFLGELLAYGAAASDLPYRDTPLLAVDRWLGFDMVAYLQFVSAHPLLAAIGPAVYLSLMWQPAIVFAILALTHRIERLHDFAVALVVALAITVAIFAAFPALGWYAALGVDAAAFPRLQLFWDFAPHLEAVRNGTLRAIPLGDLRGLISFPSFHAAAAMLAVWALWPVRLARWPVLVLNILMVAATPIEGSHYLIDVIGGIAVGICAAMAAAGIRREIRRRCAKGLRQPTSAPADPALSLGRAA